MDEARFECGLINHHSQLVLAQILSIHSSGVFHQFKELAIGQFSGSQSRVPNMYLVCSQSPSKIICCRSGLLAQQVGICCCCIAITHPLQINNTTTHKSNNNTTRTTQNKNNTPSHARKTERHTQNKPWGVVWWFLGDPAAATGLLRALRSVKWRRALRSWALLRSEALAPSSGVAQWVSSRGLASRMPAV